MFVDFLTRGLSFLLHEFVRGLLYAYGVQLHDLTPNSILHIACFIVLCECFLGMHPHWGLWRRIFIVKKHTVARRSLATGGFGIQTRNDVGYFDFKLSESVLQWRRRWFYFTVDADSKVPDFSLEARVKPRKTWRHELTSTKETEANQLLS